MTRKYLWLALCAALVLLASCQKAPSLSLTSPTSIEVSADGASSTISFTANRDWTASSSDSWVRVSPSSGSASDGAITVTVRCDANTTYEDRSATVTIKAEELTQTISVRQPANLGIVVPTKAYNLSSDGGSIEVVVQANVQYSVSASASWIKQTGTKGLTSKTLVFSVEENTTYDNREGTITVKSQTGGIPDQVISVKQAQKDALIVKDSSFSMPYGGGGIEVKVEANVNFDVKPSADWIHHVETKALNSSTIVLSVDENETYSTREGKIEITQKNGSLSHTIMVKQAGRIAVTSVTLDKTELRLEEGTSETLTATVKPDNATDKTVTWSSSDSSVATVDESGTVTAVKTGTASVTAIAGEKSAKCAVIVYKEIPVTSIELDQTALTIMVGGEVTLNAIVKPDEATDKTIIWTSSNNGVATVDNGVVKGVAIGTARITASSGSQSASCDITVLSGSNDGVYARSLGGSVVSINGVIQQGSKLNFGIYNFSSETIQVVSLQLINGVTGVAGNVMTLNTEVASGKGSAWTVTIGALGIQSPIARFVYLFKGEEYTCEARY